MSGAYAQLVDEVTRSVLDRLHSDAPRALLVGPAPPVDTGYRYVDRPPYEAVVIGRLELGELLYFRCSAALQALLEGKPVLLWSGALPHRQAPAANRLLYARCLEAERQLQQLGVRMLGQPEPRHLITAQQARQLRRTGGKLPPGAVLTPLARDILEGAQ